MEDNRIIPVLLVDGDGLYKTLKFKDPRYLGDPINAVRIFNEKEVDEICILDIGGHKSRKPLPLEFLEEVVSEAFVPVAFGGSISNLEQARKILQTGVEKLCVNTAALNDPSLITRLSTEFGSSSVVVSIDLRIKRGKYLVCSDSGTKVHKRSLESWIDEAVDRGAGELLINSIDRDGTMSGYDLDLLKFVTSRVSIPVIGCGGAGDIQHVADAFTIGGVTGAAAGSLFVYQGPHRAVLISFPDRELVQSVMKGNDVE